MPTVSDFLFKLKGGALQGVWVRMVNNLTSTAYVSSSATDSNGLYTMAVLPAGLYTVYTGPTNTGPWSATGDANYAVPVAVAGLVGDIQPVAAASAAGVLDKFAAADHAHATGAAAQDSLAAHLAGIETFTGAKTFGARMATQKDFVHSTRVATEAELVAGLDATLAETVVVTLTANRVMGVPANGADGHRMKVVLIQDGSGNHTLDTSAISVTNWALNLTASKSTELPLERISGVWVLALNPASTGGVPISKGGMVWNVLEYGGVADCIRVNDCAIAAGTNVLSSFSHAFTAVDVGKPISVTAAGALNGDATIQSLESTITGLSGVNALLADNAVTTVLGPRTVSDGAMTVGDARINSATAAWTEGDYGRYVTVSGAGPAGANLVGFIQGSGVQHPQTATETSIDIPAATTVTNATLSITGGVAAWGTDNRTIGQATIDAAGAAGGGTALWPLVGTGVYYMTHDPTPYPVGGGFSSVRPCLRIKPGVECTSAPGVVLVGGGMVGSGSTVVLENTGTANGWRLRGLSIDALYQGREAFNSCINFGGGNDIRIEACELQRYGSGGVRCMAGFSGTPRATRVVWDNNYIHDGAGGHIIGAVNADDFVITRTRGLRCSNSGGEVFPLSGCTRWLLANNVVDGGTTISTNPQGSSLCFDGMVLGNYIKSDCISAGAAITVATGPRIAIIANEFDQSLTGNSQLNNGLGGAGISVQASVGFPVNDILVIANLLRMPSLIGVGIAINLSSGGTAANWVISDNRGINAGFQFAFGSIGVSGFAITGNVFDSSFGDRSTGAPALIHSSVIANNEFLDITGRGHYVGGNDSEYSNNYWSSSRDNLLEVTGQRNAFRGGRMHHNAVEGTGTRWILESSPAGANVYENIRLTAVSTTVRIVGLLANGNSVIRDCPGWNPVGPLNAATPAFPATTVLAFNNTGMDGVAYVTAGTAAITAISKGAIPAPVNLTFTESATGGILLHSTVYSYRVSAVMRRNLTVGSFGPSETVASSETSITTGAGADTRTVTVKWLPVPGANYYKVYGRTAAGELFMANVGGHLSSWLDDGSITPAGALPSFNATARTVTGATIAASTTMPIPLRANEGIAFTFASGAPSWILDLN